MKEVKNGKELTSYDMKHIFKIQNKRTGKIFTSVGSLEDSHCHGLGVGEDFNKCSGSYFFKTADNEASVKEIEFKNGKYTIKNMMRNKPVPEDLIVIGHYIEELYTEDEKKKNELMYKVHSALKRKCGYYNDYIKFEKPIMLTFESIGKTVAVEYFTADYFGCNDIINYKTDHVRMKDLSFSDIEKVYNNCL